MMQKVKLIKRKEAVKLENQHLSSSIVEEEKLQTIVETVREWVEQNRVKKNRSPRKQFSTLFSS